MGKTSQPAGRIKGIEVSYSKSIEAMLESMKDAGLQASELANAAQIINEAKAAKAKVFLAFTTNIISSGMREIVAKLCRERKVDVIITAIGSVEEDVMKSFCDFEKCSFEEDDYRLNRLGKNRVGNIIIPNKAYVMLEKKLMPFFEKEYLRQKKEGRMLAPHEIIADLGNEIEDENSFVYWAAKNKIPVFCPAPTDGAFGLQLYFYKQKNKEFGIDVSGDLKPLGQIVLDAEKTAGIILGGGVAKHHAIGVNILRGGFDYAIYVSTGTPYDGSLSGARVNEAISWGKVSQKAKIAHVNCDASVAFPFLASIMLK